MNKLFLMDYFLIQHDVTYKNQKGRHLKDDDSSRCNRPISEPSTTWTEQDGTNLPIKNYQNWNDSVFLATVSLPIYPLTYWSNTMSRNLPTKTTFDINYIFTKLRDLVVTKEYDKILCHRKGIYINNELNSLYGNV